MRVGIYARVSSDTQQARATIGSQLQTLRDRIAAEGEELVEEFLDDGYSGARLDRPGLDRLRDAAETGAIDAIWCLSPDRLARSYAYQILILDEFARYQVPVRFADAPPLDDPQGRLLVQIQGVIAEHERSEHTDEEQDDCRDMRRQHGAAACTNPDARRAHAHIGVDVHKPGHGHGGGGAGRHR